MAKKTKQATEWLTVPEAAEVAGVTRAALYARIDAGALGWRGSVHPVSGRRCNVEVRRADVEALIRPAVSWHEPKALDGRGRA